MISITEISKKISTKPLLIKIFIWKGDFCQEINNKEDNETFSGRINVFFE